MIIIIQISIILALIVVPYYIGKILVYYTKEPNVWKIDMWGRGLIIILFIILVFMLLGVFYLHVIVPISEKILFYF
jgi:hypothetical protein